MTSSEKRHLFQANIEQDSGQTIGTSVMHVLCDTTICDNVSHLQQPLFKIWLESLLSSGQGVSDL